MRIASCIWLSPVDRDRLETIIRDGNSFQKHVWRARIVLLSAEGLGTMEIMRRTGKSKPAVWRWQERYLSRGVEGLLRDKSRPPGIAPLGAEIEALVLSKTMEETPPGATHWSARSMARAVGIGHTSVQKIWARHGLKPHLTKSFKISNDPLFAEKAEDIIGLYMNPPDKALVFSVDEKSQIQALDRTQPGLPLKKGRAGTMTHDYKRNGTTTLFAALNILNGEVIGQCLKRHRHEEFLIFLKKIDRETPADKDIHIIIDNYATHKHPKVKAWLKKHPRFHFHFTPTSASWINMVERFFGEITRKRIRRGVFESVPALEKAIYEYLERHNQTAQPFVWTKPAAEIMAKVDRARKTLEKIRAGTKC